MLDANPSFQVWVRTGEEWDNRRNTLSLEEAYETSEALLQQGEQVALCEWGEFAHEGIMRQGYVCFAWSPALDDFMGSSCALPVGHGRSEDFGVFVEYTSPTLRSESNDSARYATPWGPPNQNQLTTSSSTQDLIDDPQEYRQVSCDLCGRIGPMNQFQWRDVQEKAGRTSGTSRRSQSSSAYVGYSSSSHTYRSGSSTTSGRTYYKYKKYLLCSTCNASKKKEVNWEFVIKCAGILLFIIIVIAGSHH